ncbi:MAG: hypothetical protein WB777_08545 [Mycobacterium sp.]
MSDNHDHARPAWPVGSDAVAAESDPFPDWFIAFLHDRQTRKPSSHTMKAYRQDFAAIASVVTNGEAPSMKVVDITKDSMRAAFAAYAHDHEAASIRRCWSTWNVLCTFLYTGEQLAANPMQMSLVDWFFSCLEPKRPLPQPPTRNSVRAARAPGHHLATAAPPFRRSK